MFIHDYVRWFFFVCFFKRNPCLRSTKYEVGQGQTNIRDCIFFPLTLNCTLLDLGVNYTCSPGSFIWSVANSRSLSQLKAENLNYTPSSHSLLADVCVCVCVCAYMQAKANAGSGTEAEPGDSDTAANQRFITQPSSLLPSGDSHHPL